MIILFFFIGKTLNHTHVTREINYLFYGTSLGLLVVYLLFMGSAVGFFLIYQQTNSVNILLLIIILIGLFGLLASSRLYLKAHTPKEVYLGFFAGIICQFIAYFIF